MKKILHKTNWDEYYSKPSKIAGFTRKITQSLIIHYIDKYKPNNNDFSIHELGGANSCFLDGILETFPDCNYRISDNSSVGISLSKINFSKYKNTLINEIDILHENSPFLSDIVLSVGLIEHFSTSDTGIMIKKHFMSVKQNGIVIITYPTPTISYQITRKILEMLSLWQFHDERPLKAEEVQSVASQYGEIIVNKINRLIPLSQGIIVCIKS